MPRLETNITFVMMGTIILGKVGTLKIAPPENIEKLVNQYIHAKLAKRPGQKIFLEYEINILLDTAQIIPKNLFTALSLHKYNVQFTLDTPFKIWKRFIISYGPSCTGYFLV